ncbi:hypothetical protein BCR33DRAFT_455320 [Rhizoclosmatium globosum]|uniref:RNI-like protein n=1 Tax=Rhizoclosmatium globosum TaxID=329046 RepID=A0A1Y2CWQ1_9FUNG|nr:hypothetical protein BCR33DRAFT_455320 [Rhizoclosmatium globosum]|eukprot:ORY51459.1 hypothetical protein BCR33DRAFT_455320 [Rhizoclosmatium globosum]
MSSNEGYIGAVYRLPMAAVQRIGVFMGSGGDRTKAAGRDLVKLALVHRTWTSAALSALYRCPPLTNSDSFERLLAALALDKYAALVTELDLCGAAADNVMIGDLDGALQLTKNSLRILRLGSVFHMSNMIVQSIATHCEHLMQLELPGCPVSDAFIPLLAKRCSKLLRLDAAFTNLSVGSLVPIVKFAGAMLELDLSECREPEPGLDLAIMPDIRRPLKFLNLRNTQITNPLLSFTISHCPFLEILILESCSKITDESLSPLFSSCPHLRSLDISFCDAVTDTTINAITRHATTIYPETPNLEELYLSGCDLITPLAIHKMVSKTKKLEMLVLDGCELVCSSYVKEYAVEGGDDLECTLEKDGLTRLAKRPVEGDNGADPTAGMLSPPMSPVMQMQHMMSDLKVEVSYGNQSVLGNLAKVGRTESGFAKVAMLKSPELQPASLSNAFMSMDEKEAAEYKALQESAANSSSTGTRRQSKTLRHRKSLLGLSARADEEDVDELQEALKHERAEKIKEKRRSGGNMLSAEYGSTGSGGSMRSTPQHSSPSLSQVDLHEKFLAAANFPRPESSLSLNAAGSLQSVAEEDDDTASKQAAFLAAAAAKGLKISAPTPGSSEQSPRTIKKRPSSILRADVAAFIPVTSPNAESAALNDEPAYVAPPPANKDMEPKRRISVGIPSGPPPPDGRTASWNAPVGIAPNPVVASVAAPPMITTPTGETGVLLFSGRASRMSMNRESASTPTPVAPPTGGVEGEEAPVVIASGRRRRGTSTSILEDSKTAAAVAAFTAPGPGLQYQQQQQQPPQIPSSTLPSWATAPVPPPVTTQPSSWGTDPTVWNNPAQLTSASSTWSSTPAASQQFADPWAPRSNTPLPSQQGPKGEPATSVLGPAPVINSMDPWAAPPASALNAVNPPSTIVNSAASGINTWQKPGPPSNVAVPPPRPAAVSARFGSLGSAGMVSNMMSTPPGLLANPPGLGALQQQQQQQQRVSPPPATGGEKSETGFVYSVQNRGRLLLKLKIETKIGGEQMLAVHEYDDPQQLATEFVNYWELQAFKDPLVRLIAVRKTNVLRNRGAMNA